MADVSAAPFKAVLPEDVKEKAADRVGDIHIELAKYQQREGTFSTPAALKNAKTMPPATWWAIYGKHVPKLKAVACAVLAQFDIFATKASSVAV